MENGAIAQLGERFNGIEEVVGSIPSGSTNNINGLSSIAPILVCVSVPNRHLVATARRKTLRITQFVYELGRGLGVIATMRLHG